jgi:hypothetical protein
MWLNWAFSRISGGTAPWTTSEPNNDLASCTVYHAKELSPLSGTYKRTAYYGGKVDSATLSVSEASTEAILDLDLTFAGQDGNQFDPTSDPNSTVFPTPTDDNFPIDPYVFLYAGGSSYVTFGGSVRTQFTDLTVSVQNAIARRYFANRYVQLARMMGRRSTVAMKNLLVAATDRTHYEGLASEACSIELSNGTHGFTFDFKAQNILTQLQDDLPLADLYFEAGTSLAHWDPAAGTDWTLTIA